MKQHMFQVRCRVAVSHDYCLLLLASPWMALCLDLTSLMSSPEYYSPAPASCPMATPQALRMRECPGYREPLGLSNPISVHHTGSLNGTQDAERRAGSWIY